MQLIVWPWSCGSVWPCGSEGWVTVGLQRWCSCSKWSSDGFVYLNLVAFSSVCWVGVPAESSLPGVAELWLCAWSNGQEAECSWCDAVGMAAGCS